MTSGTIRIPLGPSGKPVAWATVDLEDYERLTIHRWYLSGRGYAFRSRDGKSVFMHREVLGFPDSEDIDHVNGDKLDNRRANLNPCTHKHNCRVGQNATVLPLRDELRNLRLAGWTNKRIAERFSISEQTVSKYTSDLPRVDGSAKKVWTRDRLIEAVQDFHAKHGRIPTGSDLNGKDGMPWFTTVYRNFPGGVADLRAAAGFVRLDLRRREAA